MAVVPSPGVRAHYLLAGTVLKESDDLDILGETFDFKMTFKKHLILFPEQLLKELVS